MESLEGRVLLSGGPVADPVLGNPIADDVTTGGVEVVVVGVDSQNGYPLPPTRGPITQGNLGSQIVAPPATIPVNGIPTVSTSGSKPNVSGGGKGGPSLASTTVTITTPPVTVSVSGRPGL